MGTETQPYPYRDRGQKRVGGHQGRSTWWFVKSALIEAAKDVQTVLTLTTQMHGSLGNVLNSAASQTISSHNGAHA